MAINYELEQAIVSVLEDTDETSEFKRRFRKLIKDSLENDFQEDDIIEVISLIDVKLEGEK